MKKNWSDFIQENEEEFNREIPAEKVWDRIESTLRKTEPRMIRLSTAVSAAAAILLLVVSAWFLYSRTESEEKGESAHVNNRLHLKDASPELAEAEVYYVSEIDHTLEKLNNLDPDEELMEAVEDLDKEFNALVEEKKESVNREEIVQAMIENYRLKLEILRGILEQIESSNSNTMENEYSEI